MKKILLMGREGVGKTSMHSVIFSNYSPKDVNKLYPTWQRKEHKLLFMGNLTFNLWDCGGQDKFMEDYFKVERETIFKNVEVLIYVFDVAEAQETIERSLNQWQQAVKCLSQYNGNASIFVLLHKMDKIAEKDQEATIHRKVGQVSAMIESCRLKVKSFFPTSIWEDSLYKAWSAIVQELVPNRELINKTLKELSESSMCVEACLFEKTTFLTLGSYQSQGKTDLFRYENISKLIKRFRDVCSKYARKTERYSWASEKLNMMIMDFTEDENILMVFEDPNARIAAEINLGNIGKVFQSKKNTPAS